MAADSATRLHRFLPYAFREHGLTAQVTGGALDGVARPTLAIDAERHQVSLVGQRFGRAALDVSVAVPATVLSAVLPPEERAHPPVALLALVECKASRCRQRVALTATAPGDLRFSGRVELVRDELWGAAELSFFLVRTAPSKVAAGSGWAVDLGARLASGRGWEVRIDPAAPVRGEYLDVREEDFAQVGPPQFPQPDALYQLDCESELVILWLNSAKTRLAPAWHAEGTVGRLARLRDALFDRIYGAVWLRLFVRAAQELVRGGEPAYPWQTAVLQQWLPRLYPEHREHDARVTALCDELEEGELSAVLGRLDLLIQDENQAAHLFQKLVEETEA
jgi:hypothetical protein